MGLLNVMITKAQKTAEIVEFDRLRLDPKIQGRAYELCDHEARCFEVCIKDRHCFNRAIVGFAWSLLTRRN